MQVRAGLAKEAELGVQASGGARARDLLEQALGTALHLGLGSIERQAVGLLQKWG